MEIKQSVSVGIMNKLYTMLRNLRLFNQAVTVATVLSIIAVAGITDISEILLLVLSILFASIFVFSFNNVFDIKEDLKKNDAKSNPVALKALGGRSALLVSSLFAILALALASFLSMERLALISAFIFVGGLYSMPPIRLKERPPLDIIAHTVLLGPVIVLLVTTNVTGPVFYLFVFYTLIAFLGQIWNQLSDFYVDKKTFLISIGLKNGKALYSASCAVGLLFFIYEFSIYQKISLLIAAALFLYSLFKYKPGKYAFEIWAIFFLFAIASIFGV